LRKMARELERVRFAYETALRRFQELGSKPLIRFQRGIAGP
jgi:hypothetical protein